MSGVVFDEPSRSLRRVVGMIGNAYASAAIVADLEWAQAGPGAKLALGVREGRMFAITGLTDEPQWAAVAIDAAARPIAWSEDGKQVLLTAGGTEGLNLVRLENGAVTTQSIVIPGNGVVSGAVLLPGGKAIVSRHEGDTGDVWHWDEGQLAAVAGLTKIVGLTLSGDGTQVYGFDPLQSELVRLKVSGREIEQERFGNLAGAGEMTQLAVQANGAAIYYLARTVDRGESWHIEKLSVDRDQREKVDLEVAPLGFSSGPSPRYRLIEYSRKNGDPFFFLDLKDGSTLFVPVGGK